MQLRSADEGSTIFYKVSEDPVVDIRQLRGTPWRSTSPHPSPETSRVAAAQLRLADDAVPELRRSDVHQQLIPGPDLPDFGPHSITQGRNLAGSDAVRHR